jgi:lipopolysaccharide assembly protein A
MKLVVWIVGVPLLLVAVFFAVANRGPVTVSLWPFADPIALPLFAAIVGPLYVGVIIGAIAAWWSGRRARKRARQERRRADALQREAESLKQRLDAHEAAKASTRPGDGASRDLTQASPPAPVLH